MPSLLLVVFLVELFAHLVNTIGAATITTLLWNIYLALPTQTSRDLTERKKLQAEYLKVRHELNTTSSQDQFARWAKVRRQHDKLLEQLEKSKSSGDTVKTKFDSTVGIVRWTATSGVKFILPFWYAKQPIFWLPKGWFPYYVEWVLSFPRAPLGSISIASWQLACSGFISLVSDTITAILGLILGARLEKKQQSGNARGGAKGESASVGSAPAGSKEANRKKDS